MPNVCANCLAASEFGVCVYVCVCVLSCLGQKCWWWWWLVQLMLLLPGPALASVIPIETITDAAAAAAAAAAVQTVNSHDDQPEGRRTAITAIATSTRRSIKQASLGNVLLLVLHWVVNGRQRHHRSATATAEAAAIATDATTARAIMALGPVNGIAAAAARMERQMEGASQH